jgi:hypothetical protein
MPRSHGRHRQRRTTEGTTGRHRTSAGQGCPRTWATALVGAALALAVPAVLAGCGVPAEREPHAIDGPVPEEPAEDPDTGADHPGEDVTVQFLHRQDGESRLVPVRRTVSRPRTDTGVLEALLLHPPTEGERAVDITTAIPVATMLADPPERTGGDVLVVDLSSALFDARGGELRSAYAQIVCTATRIDGVRAVRFEVEGDATPALDGRGEATDRPLRCEDYAELAPPVPAPAGPGPPAAPAGAPAPPAG